MQSSKQILRKGVGAATSTGFFQQKAAAGFIVLNGGRSICLTILMGAASRR